VQPPKTNESVEEESTEGMGREEKEIRKARSSDRNWLLLPMFSMVFLERERERERRA
jgi:hypothetical protein